VGSTEEDRTTTKAAQMFAQFQNHTGKEILPAWVLLAMEVL
jgi:hypothetical protein